MLHVGTRDARRGEIYRCGGDDDEGAAESEMLKLHQLFFYLNGI